jgi:hypothetical protein
VLLHDPEELDDDLGGGADEHLLLAGPLSVEDAPQAVSEYVDFHVLNGYLFRLKLYDLFTAFPASCIQRSPSQHQITSPVNSCSNHLIASSLVTF